MPFDDAARALYQVPLANFVEERKRLAAELKAAGSKLDAQRLVKLARPPVTVWAVNQLYWHARDPVDGLFAAAEHLRAGDLSATTAHRDALAQLRQRATSILDEAGHAANEATLRRIALTLSALAAAGTWDPDAPGQLSTERDPPGFDAVGVINPPRATLPTKQPATLATFTFAAISPSMESPQRSALDELTARRKHQMAESAEANRVRFMEEKGIPIRNEAPAPLPATKPLQPGELLAPANANRTLTDTEKRKADARAKLRKELEARVATAQESVSAAESDVGRLTDELAEATESLATARAALEDARDALDALD